MKHSCHWDLRPCACRDGNCERPPTPIEPTPSLDAIDPLLDALPEPELRTEAKRLAGDNRLLRQKLMIAYQADVDAHPLRDNFRGAT